jgi:hypothetical protein
MRRYCVIIGEFGVESVAAMAGVLEAVAQGPARP